MTTTALGMDPKDGLLAPHKPMTREDQYALCLEQEIARLRTALTAAESRIAELSQPCWREDDVEHPCGRTT